MCWRDAWSHSLNREGTCTLEVGRRPNVDWALCTKNVVLTSPVDAWDWEWVVLFPDPPLLPDCVSPWWLPGSVSSSCAMSSSGLLPKPFAAGGVVPSWVIPVLDVPREVRAKDVASCEEGGVWVEAPGRGLLDDLGDKPPPLPIEAVDVVLCGKPNCSSAASKLEKQEFN